MNRAIAADLPTAWFRSAGIPIDAIVPAAWRPSKQQGNSRLSSETRFELSSDILLRFNQSTHAPDIICNS
jgi:hypothetical protein